MLCSSLVPGLLAIAVSEAVPHSGLVVSKSYMSTSIMSEIAAESADFLLYCALNVAGRRT